MTKKKFVRGSCESHAPKYVVTCGGISEVSWHMILKEARTKVKELRDYWDGTGVYPTISLMKTQLLFQKEVGTEF